MCRAMECQRLRRVLRVLARQTTGMVLLVEFFIFDRLRQSSNCVRELFARFPPFLAQTILFGTVAHFLTYRPPDTKCECSHQQNWRESFAFDQILAIVTNELLRVSSGRCSRYLLKDGKLSRRSRAPAHSASVLLWCAIPASP
jgi:hypothetical protein